MARAKFIYIVRDGLGSLGYFTVKHEAIAFAEKHNSDAVISTPDGKVYVPKLVWEKPGNPEDFT